MANTKIPVELSSTPGIVDNSNATAITIDSSENVGIGTSSPTRKFHVIENANNDVATFINNDATNGYGLNINAGGTASGRYSLRVANQANTVVLQANADGNVGINTSSPDENLTISSTTPTIKLIDSDGTQQNTIIKQSGGNFFVLARDNTNNAGIVFAGNGGGSFSEYARFDTSGNFGIGTSSPQKTLDVTGTFAISNNTSSYWDFDRDDTDGSLKIADTGTERMRINSSGQVLVNPLGVSTPSFAFTNDTNTGITRPTGDTLQFVTGGSERMRIQSNGRTALFQTTGGGALTIRGEGGTSFIAISFTHNSDNGVGYIQTAASSVTYSTSSDYRLKENVVPMENGLKRIQKLKPVKFNWKLDGEESEGFLAHEVQEAGWNDGITGSKDDNLIEEGQQTYQAMDYGRITPLLVKAIQEQQAQIEALQSEINKLKGE